MKNVPVEIQLNKQTIRGNLFTPDQPARAPLAVLFIHGWTGKPNTDAAALLAANGYCALTISMRGHSPSDGNIKEVTPKNGLDDAIAAYDFLQSHAPNKGIVVVGNSYGGFMGVLLSQERRLEALSLRVPANYPDGDLNKRQWGEGNENPKTAKWRLQPLKYTQNKALQALHDFTGSVQILESENDDVVAAQTVKNYAESVTDKGNLEYLLLKDWPHSMGTDARRNKQLQDILLNWLNDIQEKV